MRKVAFKQVRDKYLCLAFHLRSPIKYVSSQYNLYDTCLSSACAAWLARGTHGARTRSIPHGTSTYILKVSRSNFGGSVTGELI
jgi:hypothetical protein